MKPQLFEMTETLGSDAASASAVKKPSTEPSPSTRTMLAWGAMACAHSTSSDSSRLASPLEAGSELVLPVSLIFWKLGGSGRPKYLSN